MKIQFRLQALQDTLFEKFLDMDEPQLLAHRARWLRVDAWPGYPCRVSLVDAGIGERVLALAFTHHAVASPYRASGPIFVREGAVTATPGINEIPLMFRHRLLAVRAYDAGNCMIAADLVEGGELEQAIEKQFTEARADYLHLHNAGPGCYNCAVVRA